MCHDLDTISTKTQVLNFLETHAEDYFKPQKFELFSLNLRIR